MEIRQLNQAMNQTWRTGGLLLGLFVYGAVFPQAATYFVGVRDSGFSPSSLTITPGDEVIWVNLDGQFHTTTSTLNPTNPDYWNVWLLDEDDAFGKVFNTIGEFAYYDQFTSKTGLIIVTGAVTPEITLNTPRLENGAFHFEVSGLTPGRFVVLEASTNLTSWSGLSTNFITAAPMSFTNVAAGTRSFFRVYETETP
jgi:plastocyanin